MQSPHWGCPLVIKVLFSENHIANASSIVYIDRATAAGKILGIKINAPGVRILIKRYRYDVIFDLIPVVIKLKLRLCHYVDGAVGIPKL